MVCCDTSIVGSLSRSESIFVAVSPETLYDLVSDVTRTGEWSPICTACWWHDEAERPRPGAWFSGRNEADGRTWKTRGPATRSSCGTSSAVATKRLLDVG